MKYALTFVATGMKGAIDVDYIWVAEQRGPFWVIQSPDIDCIAILHPTRFGAESMVMEYIKLIWVNSNIFVSVKKVASSVIEEPLLEQK